MTKIGAIRDKTVDQLGEELARLKKEQFNLRFQRASGQLENTARFRVVRRDIARIMTVLQQRTAEALTTQPPVAGQPPKKQRKGIWRRAAQRLQGQQPDGNG